MERHPVPQNIMEVEFKLFGAFSVRQFGYLAAGFIVALIIYFLKWPVLVKLILMFFSGIMGIILAVVKINGQHSSVYIANYLLALFRSQERIWKKTSVTPESLKLDLKSKKQIDDQLILRAKKRKISATPIASLASQQVPEQVKASGEIDKFEASRLDQIDKYFTNTINDVNKTINIKRDVEPPSISLSKQQRESLTKQQNNQAPVVDPSKMNLANSYQESPKRAQPVTISDNYAAVVTQTQNVKTNRPMSSDSEKVSYDDLKNELLSLQSQEAKEGQQTAIGTQTTDSSFGNTIAGQVLSKNGVPIKEAVVNIFDLDENLVRRIVTNSNGMFIIKSPLENGTYFVDISSNEAKFSRYKIILSGNKKFNFSFKAK